jgi:hypothetical protein
MNDKPLETVEERYALVRRAFDVKKDIELRYLEMGAVLKEIRDSGAWEDTYESFDNPKMHNFIEDLRIKKSTANKLIQIYEKLVIDYKIKPEKLLEAGGWSKLAEVLPLVKDKTTADHYVNLAISARNQKDLRENIREEKTGIIMSECPHNDFYVLKICRRCGERGIIIDSGEFPDSDSGGADTTDRDDSDYSETRDNKGDGS